MPSSYLMFRTTDWCSPIVGFMSRSLFPMLLFHEVCHSSKIHLLIDGLKLENGILKEVGSYNLDKRAIGTYMRVPLNKGIDDCTFTLNQAMKFN